MQLDKRKIFFDSWQILKSNLGLWVLIMLFMLMVNLIISSIQGEIIRNITIQSAMFTISGYLFQAGLNLGTIKIALNMINNKKVGFINIFENFHLLFRYVSASILVLLFVLLISFPGICFLLLFIADDGGLLSSLESIDALSFIILIFFIIIPAAYASIRMQFYNYFIVARDSSVIDSIINSINLTKGHAGELFIIGSIMSIIILISFVPLLLGLLISIPLSIIVNTTVFVLLNQAIIDE